MKTTITNINLNDYEMSTREELAQEMIDCDRAVINCNRKLNALDAQYSFTIGTKEQHAAAIEKEKAAYSLESMKLSMVLELIDTTGRAY